MSRLPALIKILENSKIEKICEYASCSEVACGSCPFLSQKNLKELVNELKVMELIDG